MGRWRPPAVASSPYITAEGARALREELQHLWRKERPEVVKALSEAAAEGDRSENAEYIYRKKQLGGIDRRVRYLSKRLDQLKVIDQMPVAQDRVRFGAWVQLRDERDRAVVYRIVGADETDSSSGWISIDSPVARALLGCAIGDEIAVTTPEGERRLEICAVSFSQPMDWS